MAKAQFHKNQRVYVRPVGTWAVIERVVPQWVKDMDEPLRIHYDVGLGRRLMDRWLARTSELGSPGVHLGVGAPNARGRAFYEAYGFTLLEETSRTAWYGIVL